MERDKYLYQVRIGPGLTPEDFAGELAHAAWDVLAESPVGEKLDPHRWPNLHGLFHRVFKGRMVHYQGCGEREECRTGLTSAAEGTPFPAEEWSGGAPVFTLEFGRGLGRLTRLLAALACRKFHPAPPKERGELVLRTAEALTKVLEGRTFQSEVCAGCDARRGFRDKRLWRKEEKEASHDAQNLGGD